jgi:hypothetical protein
MTVMLNPFCSYIAVRSNSPLYDLGLDVYCDYIEKNVQGKSRDLVEDARPLFVWRETEEKQNISLRRLTYTSFQTHYHSVFRRCV